MEVSFYFNKQVCHLPAITFTFICSNPLARDSRTKNVDIRLSIALTVSYFSILEHISVYFERSHAVIFHTLWTETTLSAPIILLLDMLLLNIHPVIIVRLLCTIGWREFGAIKSHTCSSFQVLRISEISRDLGGEYVCRGTNVVGSNTINATVVVKYTGALYNV